MSVKMALRHVLRLTFNTSIRRAPLEFLRKEFHTSGSRCLFNSEALGLENFQRQRATAQEKIGDLKEKVHARMEEYMQTSDKNTIFTDDLKSIIHIADNDEDLDTLQKMITRYREQTKDLRFSNFVFGPLVMRMCHMLNKPDLAYSLFMNSDYKDGFFDQMSTFLVLMDLLFENGQYERVLTVRKIVADRLVAGFKFPTDCLTIYIATCCRLNTAEVYAEMLQILEECFEKETPVTLRSFTYAALLALKQNDAKTALDLLSRVQRLESTPVAYRNMKTLALVEVGRLEAALAELREVLHQDEPESRTNDVFTDVVSKLKTAIESNTDKEMSHKMADLERALTDGNHLNSQDFEEYLFTPIGKRRKLQDGYKSRRRSGAMGYSREGGRQSFRKGLSYSEEKVYV